VGLIEVALPPLAIITFRDLLILRPLHSDSLFNILAVLLEPLQGGFLDFFVGFPPSSLDHMEIVNSLIMLLLLEVSELLEFFVALLRLL